MKRFTLKRITALVLAIIMTLSLCPVTAWADYAEPPSFGDTTTEETHSHPTCGVTGCTSSTHGHNEVDVWTELTSADLNSNGTLKLTDGKSYYLGEDITVTSAVITTGAVNLCLNGKSLSNESGDALQVYYGDNLVVCDCSNNNVGKINGSLRGIYCENMTALTVYGGTVSGKTGIYVGSSSSNTTVTVNGGVVSGTNYGIELSGTGSTVTVNDGTVNGKTGICAPNGNNSSEVSITGGTITGTSGTAVSVECKTYISGGTISGTIASGVAYGISAGANDIYLSGAPSINGTTGDIKLNGKQIVVNGALSNGNPIGITMATPGVFAKPDGMTVTSLNAATYYNRFNSDNYLYDVAVDGDDLKLKETANPEARWGLAVDGNAPADSAWVDCGTLKSAMSYANNLTSGTAYIQLLSNVKENPSVAYDFPLDFSVGRVTILDLKGNTIDGNGNGPVIRVNGDLTLYDTSANGNGKITGGKTDAAGGGVWIGGGTFTMNGGTITGNSAKDGGGVEVEGSVYPVASGTFIMNRGTISNNTASDEGGGVSVYNGCTFTMNGGTISGNTAYRGGGVYAATGGGTFIMKGGTLSNNTAEYGGGAALESIDDPSTMSGGTISNNTADYGGGVYATQVFLMKDGMISGNKANDYGGGVYGPITMSGGTISDNTGGYGGGLYVNRGTVTVENATISGNTAGYGGGVQLDGGTFTMTSGSVSGNTATTLGGGIMLSAGSVSLSNTSTISNNTSGAESSKINDNVYLWSGKTITIGTLNNGANIGITLRDGAGKFTNSCATDAASGYIASDSAIYDVVADANGNLMLSIPVLTDVSAIGFTGTYDGQPHGITVTVPDGATVKYGTAEGVYDKNESPTLTDVGELTVYYQVTKAGYTSVDGSAKVIVTKAKVAKPAADTKVFTYDGKVQTYSVASSALYTVSGNTRTDAGTQTVTVALKDTANYEWADGTTAAVMFDFTVDRKAITVKAEAKSKVYGANEPALTYTASGLVAGETLVGELSREVGSDVDTYAITQGSITNANNPNYNITFVGAEFSITKAQQPVLAIVGKPATSIVYGDSFELSVIGGAGDGDVTWTVTEGEQYAEIDANGKVTVKGVGTVEITATKAESLNYELATDTYKFVSVRATPVLGIVAVSGIVEDTTAPAAVVLTKTAGPAGTLRITDGAMLANQSEYHWTFTPDDTNNYNAVTGTVEIDVVDTQSPAVSIKVEDNEWKEKLNDITFGIFFQKTKQVEITYADNENGSGLKETLYCVSNEAITDFTDVQWNTYTSAFNIDPDGEFVIYAKATDNDGNSIIVNSDGIVLDATAPILQGIADGETYYGDKTFKVEESYLDTLEVDEVVVTAQINEAGEYTLVADNKQHTIVVTDKAGNVTTYTVTVMKQYTVTFMVDGEVFATLMVGHGQRIPAEQIPKIPAKDGYNEVEAYWDNNGAKFVADTEITVDTVITAVYTANKHIVTFKVEDITVATVEVTHGDLVTPPSVPTVEGYSFYGWFKEQECINEWDMESEVVNGDLTLYAVGGLWCKEVSNQLYTGKALKPDIEVYFGMFRLEPNKDYTVSHKNNTNVYAPVDTVEELAAFETALAELENPKAKTVTVGDQEVTIAKVPQIIIKGKGNFSGTLTKNFVVEPVDLNDSLVSVSDVTAIYNGKRQTPKLAVTLGTKTLSTKDFTVLYPDYDETPDKAYLEEGNWTIQLDGVGNFTGTRNVTFTITRETLMSKVKIVGFKASLPWAEDGVQQPSELMLTDSTKKGADGKAYVLVEDTDYTVTYDKNTAVGTATVVFTGLGDYVGKVTKTFKITGAALSKMQVNGLPKSEPYTGIDIEPQCTLYDKVSDNDLPNDAYTVTYNKNKTVGTAEVIFTGNPERGYTGTLKKTFKITTYNIVENLEGCVTVEIANEAPYMKGGAKPVPVITFNGEPLEEGVDFTLAYKNNTAVASGDPSNKKAPNVTITGKGNYTGKLVRYFSITSGSLENVTVTASDIVFNAKGFKAPSVIVTDMDGKKLSAGKDYEKNLIYTYAEDVKTKDGEILFEKDAEVNKTDIIPAGTAIKVTVKGIGFYDATFTETTFRVTKQNISKAAIKIKNQTYTGREITLTEKDFITALEWKDDYRIVEGSYTNNINKGTASVMIAGVGDYGGTQKVTFKIDAKAMVWHEVKEVFLSIFS